VTSQAMAPLKKSRSLTKKTRSLAFDSVVAWQLEKKNSEKFKFLGTKNIYIP
jgi:hypothetical protein